MPSTDRSPRAKKSIALSVLIGTLLVPLGAYAASALLQTREGAEPPTASEAPPAAESAVTEPVSIGADLETACGEAGLGLVAAETTGTIGELQQAALDALRGVCAEQGMPLPAPATTQPAVTTATLPAPPTAPVTAEVVTASDDDDHDDDHGRHGGDDDEEGHGRHGGDDDHGRHGGDDD